MKRTTTIFPICIVLASGFAVLLLVNSIASYQSIRRTDTARTTIRPAVFRVVADGRVLGAQPRSSIVPLRRALFMNAAAAIGLLLALSIVAVRFRASVRAHQHDRQLEIARRLQANLLPAVRQQTREGIEVAADCLPAATVGGDFYDVFALPRRGSAFVLGDVCGTGMPAALLMGVLHGAVRSSSWTDSDSQHESATDKINRLLCELASAEKSATMFWAYFDPQTQFLRYINAGHFPPLLFKASRREIVPLRQGGPVLGGAREAIYRQATVRFGPGDMLVAYSGGIVQARDRTEETFGRERLLSVVDLSRGKSAREICDRILSSVRSFTGGGDPEDDRTLLVIRHTPADADSVRRSTGEILEQRTLELA